jgi:hypothetical protein
MDYFRHGTRSDDPARLKKIDDYVKEFEKDYGRKPTAKYLQTTLKEQYRVMPFYEEKYGELPKGRAHGVTNVQKDVVKLLKDSKIIAKLEAGKFPTIADISRVTKLDPTLAETRSVDFAERLRDIPKYKTLADKYLDQPGVSTKDKIFGGKKGKRARVILENRFTKLMGLDQKLPSLRKNILNKIQRIIPELKGILAVDEIAGLTTSMRRGSGPYAIFGQILGTDFNTEIKGKGIDKNKGKLEKMLVKLDKKDPKRIELQKNYNEKVDLFEASANKDNPAKKVKGLKLSFKPPSETIKNKKIYSQYKDLFDAHFEKHGYSFEVPADRDSLVDISKKLDNKSFQGIIKNRFKNLKLKGGKIGVLVGLGTLAGTGFALADEALAADGTEAGSMLPEAAAVASPFISKASGAAGGPDPLKYLRKGARKAASSILSPLGAGAIWGATGGVDLESGIDRAGLGAEAAFSKELVKHSDKLTKPIQNQAMRSIVRGVLNAGMPLKWAMRAARIASPIGWATLGAEGIYQLGKYAMEEQKKFEALSPEEQADVRAEQEEMAQFSAAEGGRVGFDKGSPKSPSRRAFIKGVTALAALPIVGKYFKVGKLLKSGAYTGPIVEKIKGMPEWFPSLVKKLWNEGDDVTKTVATGERQIIKRGTLEGGDDVDLVYQMDTGDVSIQVAPKKGKYETTSGAYNKEYELEYDTEKITGEFRDLKTEKFSHHSKKDNTFQVVETEPVRTGHPEDPDWDWDGTITTVDDAMSDLTELEAFAKNKTIKQIHKKKGTKKKDVFPEVEYDDSYDLDYDID